MGAGQASAGELHKIFDRRAGKRRVSAEGQGKQGREVEWCEKGEGSRV
jgi:hypothetical protein